MSRLVLRNASIIDGVNPGACRETEILIESGHIAAVARRGEISTAESDSIVDLSGKTVMPGMCIGHFHAEYDAIGTMGTMNSGIERPYGVMMAYAIKNMKIALDAGYTAALGTGCAQDMDACLEMAMNEKVMKGPRLVPCTPHIVPTGAFWPATPWWIESKTWGLEQGQCTGADAFRKVVREQVFRGARMIKILPSGGHGFPSTKGCRNFTVDELKAVTDAAHERGAWIRAHVNYVDQILECVEAGVDVLDHADDINDECIEAMAKRGTHYCPTIAKSVMTVTWNPSKPRYGFMDHFGYWPDNYIEVFGDKLRRAHKAGVKLLIGDDYGPGGGFKPNFWGDEINMFVNEFRFTPFEVIQIATANGAKFFGDKTGRVAPGKVADLLVLNFDPLKDGLSRLSDPASSIAAILKDGEFMKNELATSMSLRKAS